ncbi:MAG: cytochrome c biogenesis CcdA family protein [Gemmatimonadales bacterium]|nr:cytochrome c biogenesis protein CcdA [Gemmatimonadales bacterium]HPF62010.1 cytochrome c biogenesis CcdA family protein [Gemmatimonadales bacterium]HRX18644.1 cytochrome c biogenesis CcdA family protein [Gemmatimonadales bacterium]
MNDGPSLILPVAFAAGLLSFLSPCVLPLVPSYLGFLTGMTIEEMGDRRRWALWHALLFVAGFSVIFIALGAGATALGSALRFHKETLARIGGVMLIVFGIYATGIFRIAAVERERRVHLDRKPVGFLGSFLVGMAFAAGWTPCLGPVLGGILGLGMTTGEVGRSMGLLAAYSAGLAVPFLIAAVAVDRFRGWFTRFRRWLPWVQRVSGILLIVVGLLLVSGAFTRMAALLQTLTPEWILRRV